MQRYALRVAWRRPLQLFISALHVEQTQIRGDRRRGSRSTWPRRASLPDCLSAGPLRRPPARCRSRVAGVGHIERRTVAVELDLLIRQHGGSGDAIATKILGVRDASTDGERGIGHRRQVAAIETEQADDRRRHASSGGHEDRRSRPLRPGFDVRSDVRRPEYGDLPWGGVVNKRQVSPATTGEFDTDMPIASDRRCARGVGANRVRGTVDVNVDQFAGRLNDASRERWQSGARTGRNSRGRRCGGGRRWRCRGSRWSSRDRRWRRRCRDGGRRRGCGRHR